MAAKRGRNADVGRLRGKIAVVTGASRGIGRAIAHALCREGCDVVLAARRRAAMEAAARSAAKQGGSAIAEVCDVRRPGDVEALFRAVKKRSRRVDILVNNAGIAGPSIRAADLRIETWREVIETTLTSVFLCTRAALPLMPRGSVIVNNISIAAVETFQGMAAYCAAKHGAFGFTNVLREELREKGIRVIALMPGATDTDIWKQFWADAPREKMMSPDTVAEAVVNALTLPSEAALEQIILKPVGGTL